MVTDTLTILGIKPDSDSSFKLAVFLCHLDTMEAQLVPDSYALSSYSA